LCRLQKKQIEMLVIMPFLSSLTLDFELSFLRDCTLDAMTCGWSKVQILWISSPKFAHEKLLLNHKTL
jgi:hypothetical protein